MLRGWRERVNKEEEGEKNGEEILSRVQSKFHNIPRNLNEQKPTISISGSIQ